MPPRVPPSGPEPCRGNYHKGENEKTGFSVVFVSGKDLTNGNLVLEFKDWSRKLWVHACVSVVTPV